MGAASGGRLTLWLVTLAVLMASGATGIVVIGTGSTPPHGSPTAGQVTGSSGQRLAGDRKGTAAARLGPGGSGAGPGGSAANAKGRYNVGATHSPELLRALAGPLDGTGLPGSSSRARGVDVAADQHPRGANIDWARVAAAGYSFAAVKATEGDYYANPWYADDAASAEAAGLQVTGYHVAIPNVSGGAAQADFAVGHLGPARALEIDVEYDPYTAIDHTGQCYGLTPRQLVSWIGAFTREARQLTGQAPVIYTTAAWWRACTGDSSAFSGSPLWVAGYGTGQPARPGAWASWSCWQFSSAATVPGIPGRDADVSYAGSRSTTPFAPAEAAGARESGGSGGSSGGSGGAAAASAAAGAAEAGGLAGLTGGSVASGQPVAEVTRPATSPASASAAPSSPVPALVAPAPAATAPAPVVASPSPGPSG